MGLHRLYWLLLILFVGVIAFAPFPRAVGSPGERLIRVDASQFSYEPGDIRVNEGDLVTIELSSTDSVHGLYVDGYGISVTADPGQTRSLTFTADHTGSFRFRCNVTCGALHPFMIGRLVVGRNDAFLRMTGLASLTALAVILSRSPFAQ